MSFFPTKAEKRRKIELEVEDAIEYRVKWGFALKPSDKARIDAHIARLEAKLAKLGPAEDN